MTLSKDTRILVVGGGIVGCSTAYFLSKLGYSSVTLLEAVDIAHAASGKAGGFLAKDWCDSGFTKTLAQNGFSLHKQLAKELGVDIGYREMNTLSIELKDKSKAKIRTKLKVPNWVNGYVDQAAVIGDEETTAQVHPRLLTNALIKKAIDNGVTLKKQSVVRAKYSGSKVEGLYLDNGEFLAGQVIVLAMGPWTGQGLEWFGKDNVVSGDRAHSVVFNTSPGAVDATALFLHYKENYTGKSLEPEVYPRPDGTVYVCGQGDNEPLPPDPAQVEKNEVSCKVLMQVANKVSSVFASVENVTSNACYLPCVKDNIPLIGKVPGFDKLYVATGHYCWGILQGPFTGQALADIISTDQVPKDFDVFDPSRLLT